LRERRLQPAQRLLQRGRSDGGRGRKRRRKRRGRWVRSWASWPARVRRLLDERIGDFKPGRRDRASDLARSRPTTPTSALKRAELERTIRVISPRVDLCPDLFSPVAKSCGKDGQDLVACCND
jgi:hypothetical protein